MDTNILLENGTNELEVLEFVIGNNHYGINVAKVKEIVNFQKVTPVPNAHPSVEGIFMPRDTMITVVKLANVLHLPDSDDPKNDMLINTNFNKLNVAFHVHKIVGIHRVSWADIITPDATINSAESGIATGIIKVEGRLIIILDFERIVSDISPETGLKVSDISRLGTRDRNNSPIVLAEDSMLLMKLITDSLEKAGYTNLIKCVNGQEAWNYLQNIKKKSGGDVTKYVKCIVTDIEMPIMDGHRLTKLVKTDNELKDMLTAMISECGVADMASAYICQGLMLRILWRLGTVYEYAQSRYIRKKINWLLHQEITDFIEDNMKDVTIDMLVERFGYQEDYFNRFLKAQTGMTFTEYLQDCRLNKSAILLKENSMDVDEIIKEVGYRNKGYFYRIFTEKYNMTPAKFRKYIKEKEFTI